MDTSLLRLAPMIGKQLNIFMRFNHFCAFPPSSPKNEKQFSIGRQAENFRPIKLDTCQSEGCWEMFHKRKEFSQKKKNRNIAHNTIVRQKFDIYSKVSPVSNPLYCGFYWERGEGEVGNVYKLIELLAPIKPKLHGIVQGKSWWVRCLNPRLLQDFLMFCFIF